MTENEPNIAQTDQLDARARDLLLANGLEVLDRTHLDARWLSNHTAEDLLAGLLETAIEVCRDGGLSALVAFDTPSSGVAYSILAVRRADETGTEDPT